MNKIKKGILFALLTAAVSGISILYSKLAVLKMDALVLTTSRNLFVGFLFAATVILMGRWGEIKKLQKKQILSLGIIALLGGAVPFYLFFTGLKLIPALTANIIHKSMFVWAGILAVVWLKEKISLPLLAGFGLVILFQFIVGGIPVSISAGSLMVLVATLFWSIEQILAKKLLKSVSANLIGLARMGGGGLLLLVFTIFSGKAGLIPLNDPSKLLTIGVGGTLLFLYVFFWLKALSLAPVTVVTLILTSATVVGALLTGIAFPQSLVMKDALIYTGMISGIAVAISAFWSNLSLVGQKT